MRVTVFVPPTNCAACKATKLRMDRFGIEYEVVVVDDSAGLKAEGFSEFPVVKVDCGDGASWSWSGYRDVEISELAQSLG